MYSLDLDDTLKGVLLYNSMYVYFFLSNIEADSKY